MRRPWGRSGLTGQREAEHHASAAPTAPLVRLDVLDAMAATAAAHEHPCLVALSLHVTKAIAIASH